MDGARCERAEGELSLVAKARLEFYACAKARKDGAPGT